MVETIIGKTLGPILSEYFINYNSENFKINLMAGEISLGNLIFSQKILEGQSLPLRLQFGMLGNLKITLTSILNPSEGVKIQISNVFICLKMLEVSKWSE